MMLALFQTIQMSDEESKSLQWLNAAISGDRQAFNLFYEKYSAPLFSIALRLLNSQETAGEVVQDTFVAIWRDGKRFDPGRSKLFTWMVMILRRKAIDRMRMDSRRIPQTKTEDVPRQLEDTLTNALIDPSRILESRDESAAIMKVLAELPPEQRSVIELAFFDGYTQQEIASKLDEPLGTIKSRIRLALEKLRNQLKEGNRDE